MPKEKLRIHILCLTYNRPYKTHVTLSNTGYGTVIAWIKKMSKCQFCARMVVTDTKKTVCWEDSKHKEVNILIDRECSTYKLAPMDNVRYKIGLLK